MMDMEILKRVAPRWSAGVRAITALRGEAWIARRRRRTAMSLWLTTTSNNRRNQSPNPRPLLEMTHLAQQISWRCGDQEFPGLSPRTRQDQILGARATDATSPHRHICMHDLLHGTRLEPPTIGLHHSLICLTHHTRNRAQHQHGSITRAYKPLLETMPLYSATKRPSRCI